MILHKRKRFSTVGHRTGVDLKSTYIRLLENGLENFNDYFNSLESSDSISTESSPTSSSKNNPMTSSPLRSGAPRMSSFIKDKEKTKTTPTRACKNVTFSKSPDADEAVTPVKKSKNKETHPRYSFGNKINESSVENNISSSSPIQKSEKQKRFAKGRRTGVLLDEKNIRIKDGFEIFNDYFTNTNSENSSQSGYSKISKEPSSGLCSKVLQLGIDTMRQSNPQSSHLESPQSRQKQSRTSAKEFHSSGYSEVHESTNDSSVLQKGKLSQMSPKAQANLNVSKRKTKLDEKRIEKDGFEIFNNCTDTNYENSSQSGYSKISKEPSSGLYSEALQPGIDTMRQSIPQSSHLESSQSRQKQSRTSVKEFHSSGNSEVHESTNDSSVLQKGKQSQMSPEAQTNLNVSKRKTKAQKKSKKADGQKEENQVRRSERVKIPPLERWRGQCRFTKLVNGEWITVFEEGRPEDNSAVEKIMKKQKNYQSQKKKEKSCTKYIKKRKLKDNTLNLEEVKGEISKIPVVNPSTSEDECVYLYRPYKTLLWSTPAAYDSHNSPYFISKCITGKDNIISFGYIDIEVSKTKAAQYSPTDNITFNVIQGKVELKLYKSLIKLKERDVSTVPSFNNYCITNAGKVNTILYYCSFKTPLFSYQCVENSDQEEE